MATYVMLVNYTDQGIRNIKDTLKRVEQERAASERLNVRIIGTWWTQGAYDGVVVFEAPDDQTATAGALGLGMAGNVRTQTMRAYSAEELQQVFQKLP